MLIRIQKRMIVAALVFMVAGSISRGADDKLRIVLMLGGDEMVGHARIATAQYMLQAPAVPPREVTVDAHKDMLHQINGAYLYWQAMHAYQGPPEKKAELQALLEKRNVFRKTFRQRVIDELNQNDGMFRGKKYSKRGGRYAGFWLYNLCDDECEREGITPGIRIILEAPDNAFGVDEAYKQMVADIAVRQKKQQELKSLFWDGSTEAGFASFGKVLAEYDKHPDTAKMPVANRRGELVQFAREHLNLPSAQRTFIAAMGSVDGDLLDEASRVATGRLSVGFGADIRSIGLEYAAGLALEKRLDGPILIVKCAWNSNVGIHEFGEERMKVMLQFVSGIMKDPGRYHPQYNKDAGLEISGLIWFSGLRDRHNAEYGDQLESLLRKISEGVATPSMPVVCLTVGDVLFDAQSLALPANRGMQGLTAAPDFDGRVALVDSRRWHPTEFDVLHGLFHKRKMAENSAPGMRMASATTKHGRGNAPYYGSASFYLLAGYDAGMQLATLIEGAHGEPVSHRVTTLEHKAEQDQ